MIIVERITERIQMLRRVVYMITLGYTAVMVSGKVGTF